MRTKIYAVTYNVFDFYDVISANQPSHAYAICAEVRRRCRRRGVLRFATRWQEGGRALRCTAGAAIAIFVVRKRTGVDK